MLMPFLKTVVTKNFILCILLSLVVLLISAVGFMVLKILKLEKSVILNE